MAEREIDDAIEEVHGGVSVWVSGCLGVWWLVAGLAGWATPSGGAARSHCQNSSLINRHSSLFLNSGGAARRHCQMVVLRRPLAVRLSECIDRLFLRRGAAGAAFAEV